MPRVSKSVVVAAPLKKVWSAYQNLDSYVKKLEPHVLSFELTPAGPTSVGQKIHAIVRVGGEKRREVFSEITEVTPMKRIVETHVPNDFFRKMVETVTLEPASDMSKMTVSVEYETNGLGAKLLDLIFARRTMSKNFERTLANLKNLLEGRTPATEP